MLKRMSAEILISDPHDVNECVAVLIEHDFEVEFLDSHRPRMCRQPGCTQRHH